MSYDFHVDERGNLRLIEINTNASLSLVVDTLHKHQAVPNVFSSDFRKEIIESFAEEFTAFDRNGSPRVENVAIVDESPTNQKLFLEFKLYEELFTEHGWKTTICDPSELTYDGKLKHGSTAIDLVYNRDTDFYFEKPRSHAIGRAFDEHAACITPNSHEYRLLADKERLLELSNPQNQDLQRLSEEHRQTIQTALIPTFDITSVGDSATVWKERKRFFFKPKRMFGGKAVYKGASISRGTFESVYSEGYLAQEIVPAGLVTFGADEFKYDLRFFVYRDRIQLACARLYRGQTTNSTTPGGGAAVIEWT